MGKRNITEIKKSKKDGKHQQNIKIKKKSQSKRNIRGINQKKKSYRYREILNIFREPSVIEMINNLDNQTGPLQTNQIDSTVNLEFGSNINYREFYKLFKNGLILAKKNFSLKNLSLIKNLLLLLKDNNSGNDEDVFGIKSCDNELRKVYKMDLILSLISNERKLTDLGINNISDITKSFLSSNEYALYNDKQSFKDAIIYNKNITGDFSPDNFEKILYSSTILNIYKEILWELYNIQTTTKIVKTTLKEFLKGHNIFLTSMGSDYYGMILYDGTILVNKIYYTGLASDPVNSFRIFFTLLHELMHALSRIFRNNNNFFIDTDSFTKFNKIKTNESGDYFDKKFLLNCINDTKLSRFEILYLLEAKNYNYDNLNDFHNSFLAYKNKNKKVINKALKYNISRLTKENSYSREGCCFCAGKRINNLGV